MKKITRRQFLKRSIHLGRTLSAVVAVPYIVPSSVLGKDGSVAPSERITMGGIGFGGQGTRDMRSKDEDLHKQAEEIILRIKESEALEDMMQKPER